MRQWEERKVGDRFVDEGVEYEVTEVGCGDSGEPQETIREVDDSEAPEEPMWPWVVGGVATGFVLLLGAIILSG